MFVEVLRVKGQELDHLRTVQYFCSVQIMVRHDRLENIARLKA